MDVERPVGRGARVEVRDHFEGEWVKGFEVVAAGEDGAVRVRRVSDGAELPWVFGPGDLRPAL